MSERTRAILWDVGGTLVRPARSLAEGVRRRLADCGVDHSRLVDEEILRSHADFLSSEREWRSIDQERAAERAWLAVLLRDEAIDEKSLDRAAARMPWYFYLYEPIPGIVDLLKELRERRLLMGIVSNWPPSLPEFLAHHELAAFFSPVVFSAQDGVHKPERRIFMRALELLGVLPAQAIFVGDNPLLDIAPARQMGMRAIHFDPLHRHPQCDADNADALRTRLMGMLDF